MPDNGLGSHLQGQRVPSAEAPDAGRGVGGEPRRDVNRDDGDAGCVDVGNDRLDGALPGE